MRERQYISSRSNTLVVRLSKLKDKKYRRAEGLFRFDGIKLFYEALEKRADIRYVLIRESAAQSVAERAEETLRRENFSEAQLIVLADDAFSKLTDEQSPEGIVTVCAPLRNIVNESGTSPEGRALMLESVRDAGNLGTVVRTAAAFGIDTLVISSDCADPYNPKTVRAAMGALFKQKITVTDSVTDTIAAARAAGRRVFAATLSGESRVLGSFELRRDDIILIGNEGHGLSREAIDACDGCLYIPMEPDTESLNAGIAASVCMWEMSRAK